MLDRKATTTPNSGQGNLLEGLLFGQVVDLHRSLDCYNNKQTNKTSKTKQNKWKETVLSCLAIYCWQWNLSTVPKNRISKHISSWLIEVMSLQSSKLTGSPAARNQLEWKQLAARARHRQSLMQRNNSIVIVFPAASAPCNLHPQLQTVTRT